MNKIKTVEMELLILLFIMKGLIWMETKEEPFRIKCTCDNTFQLAEGHEASIDEFLKTIADDNVSAIQMIMMEHFKKEAVRE